MTITAKFAGKCKQCGGRIEAGEQIEWERGQGSQHIACPANATPAPAKREVTVTQPGVYETPAGAIYVVKPNREKSRLYAKKLVEVPSQRATEAGGRVEIDFEYDRGAIFLLDPSMKMSLDRAKELTIRYGRCIVCGKRLKVAESVERGIGPVCVKSFRAPDTRQSSESVGADFIRPELRAQQAIADRLEEKAAVQQRERDEDERVAQYKASRDDELVAAGLAAPHEGQ